MKFNNVMFVIEVDFEMYYVIVDKVLLVCEFVEFLFLS